MHRWIEAGVGAGALAAATATAVRGVPRWDTEGFAALNGGHDRLQYVLWGPMQLGALGSPLIIAGVRLVRGDRSGAMRTAAAGSAAWIGAKVLKKAVGRARPAEHVPTTLRIGAADTGLGYPSGHAAVAVTVAQIGLAGLPAEPFHAAVPVVVGVSRIHVGAHFPLDVIGGWALGAVCVAVVDGLGDVIAARVRAG